MRWVLKYSLVVLKYSLAVWLGSFGICTLADSVFGFPVEWVANVLRATAALAAYWAAVAWLGIAKGKSQ